MKLSNILLEVHNILKINNIEDPSRESKLLICHVLNSSLEIFLLKPEMEISAVQHININELVERRLQGEPIAYLQGSVEFYRSQFIINNNVLIPRPETEVLIEVILNKISNKNKKLNILDIGVGSGIILASLLLELPNSFGIGTDISIEALKVANINLKRLNIDHRYRLINTNWAEGITNNTFDIISCNPPYISNEHIKNLHCSIRNYEPLIALKGGLNGLNSFINLLPIARKLMKKNAFIALEMGFDQSEQLKFILYKNKFKVINIEKDLSGNKRIIIATTF